MNSYRLEEDKQNRFKDSFVPVSQTVEHELYLVELYLVSFISLKAHRSGNSWRSGITLVTLWDSQYT